MYVITSLFGVHPARLCRDSEQDVQNADILFRQKIV